MGRWLPHAFNPGTGNSGTVHCAEARMPAIALSSMAENHIKTDSIGLQLQAAWWHEQEELPQA